MRDYNAEREYINKRIRETQLRVRKSNSLWAKQDLNRLYKELDKINRDEELEHFNWKAVKKVLKTLGIKKARYSATAIRGWNNVTNGWDADLFCSPETIKMLRTNEKQFNTLVEALEEAGIEIVNSRTSSSIGAGLVGVIEMKRN